jgi:putative methyltransferase (TIGR04325 family)
LNSNDFGKAIVAILASEPCRTMLAWFESLPCGKRILNGLSGPYGVFATLEEGWSAARRTNPSGHEAPDEIRIHLELSESLRASDYAVLFWLSKIRVEDLKVFDFGGNVGNLYYSYLPHLKGEFRSIFWTVFDLPVVMDRGREIAAERGATGLRFADCVEEASDCDVLLVSGAFHYWAKSVEAFLDQFRQQPKHVILNRTPIHEEQPSFFTVQRTQWCAFPCIVRNAVEILDAFSARGYTLVDRWPALELSLKLPLFPRRTVPHYSGFYFRRRDQERTGRCATSSTLKCVDHFT